MSCGENKALPSQGVLFQRGDGASPETFNTVSRVTDSNSPDGSSNPIDVSALEDVAKEYIPGLYDGGNVNISGNLIPSDLQQQGMINDRDNQTCRNFRLVLTDTPKTTITFSAFVLSFNMTAAVDGKIPFTANLKVTGKETWSNL